MPSGHRYALEQWKLFEQNVNKAIYLTECGAKGSALKLSTMAVELKAYFGKVY